MIDPFYADLLPEEAREVAYAERVFGARPTGSRWFGVNDPEDPDVDFDLYCIQQAPMWPQVVQRAGWEPPVSHIPGMLCDLCGDLGCSTCMKHLDDEADGDEFFTFRMGRLNLIMLTPDAWWRWRLTTDLCRFNRGPKSKKRRVRLFQEMVDNAGGVEVGEMLRQAARQKLRQQSSEGAVLYA